MATPHNAGDQAELKLRAAQRALEFVEPGMTVGLGSGSTATIWIKLLGEKVRNHGLKIRAIASSEDSERLGRSYGIPFVTFEECRKLDLTIDGADEIAPQLAPTFWKSQPAVPPQVPRKRALSVGGPSVARSSEATSDPWTQNTNAGPFEGPLGEICGTSIGPVWPTGGG